MALRDTGAGLFADAIELLREADRMHRQFFGLVPARGGGPCWEPPIDIVERQGSIIIRVALPGVAPDAVEVISDGPSLHIAAVRRLGAGPGDAIHRLEIPYGRFERRIELPPGQYEMIGREFADGCLVLNLRRLA